MKTIASMIGAAFLLWAAQGIAFAGQPPEEKKEAPSDPELIGEEVTEQSEIEKLLFTEYRKRRTKHFMFETSYDMETAKDYIAFCETAYREFLKWAGKPPETDLWGTRAHVAVVNNKAEWECLMRARNKGRPPAELERLKDIGGQWNSSPPFTINYSREGQTPEADKLNVFHSLNHLFCHGLAGSGHQGILWWLWEGFSFMRELDVFGARGPGCINFETAAKTPEDRAWNDVDEWVTLLKRDVRAKQDEDFILFWHKDVMNIPTKTYVKAWSMIRYFTRDDASKATFVEFVSMLKTKNDQGRAIQEIYGTDPDGVDKEWREWIKRQPNKWRKTKPGGN